MKTPALAANRCNRMFLADAMAALSSEYVRRTLSLGCGFLRYA